MPRSGSMQIGQPRGSATMATSKMIGNAVVNMVHRLRDCDGRRALRDSQIVREIIESFAALEGSKPYGGELVRARRARGRRRARQDGLARTPIGGRRSLRPEDLRGPGVGALAHRLTHEASRAGP